MRQFPRYFRILPRLNVARPMRQQARRPRTAWLFPGLLLLTLTPCSLWGQSGGPLLPEIAPGSPASSYALSGIDTVNYYNGMVNIRIPLTTIGARGTMAKQIIVPIGRQWTVSNASNLTSQSPFSTTWAPNDEGWVYFPGMLSLQTTSQGGGFCYAGFTDSWAPTAAPWNNGNVLTWLVWTASDLTQTVLVDTALGGQAQPLTGDCTTYYTGANRGTVFRSYDGSGMTFVASSAIVDGPIGGIPPSGTLYFKDGTHYTIGAGGLANPQMEDRNGNRFEWSMTSTNYYGLTETVVDSAGRSTNLTFTETPYANTPASEFDTIAWTGTAGASRSVTVKYAPLGGDSTGTPLGPGVSAQTPACLFSTDLGGASSSTAFNPWVVSSIVLPDGTSYSFTYDVYGEVASMTLPTGGRYTYTYFGTSCALAAGGAGLVAAPSGSSTSGSGVVNVGTASVGIYRRVVERDEYANGGTSMTAKATFTSVAGSPAGQTLTTAQFYTVNSDGSLVLLKTENHDFWGDPTAPVSFPVDPTQFPAWNDGVEFQTTTIDPNLGTLQTRQTVMGQRPCAAVPYDGSDCSLQGNTGVTSALPPHDPQKCQVNTTLGVPAFGTTAATGPTSGVTFAYDQYNNQTDMREFDFGNATAAGSTCPGAVTGFTRETVTTYKTDSGYVSVGPDLVSLPIQRTVYGSSGTSGAFSAQDAWTYDGGTIATASGEPGHDDTNYSASNTVRGNVTTHTVNLSSSVTASETFTYDQTGNLTQYGDFLSSPNVTTFSYTDTTHVNPTSVVNALDAANSWSTSYVYDQHTLKVTSVTDENSKVTSYSYGTDPLDRLTNVQRGATTQSHTAYTYASAGTKVTINQDQASSNDGLIQTETDYDLLGRPIGTIQYEAAGAIAATQSYDGLGRVAASSSPARPGDGVYSTTYTYNALGWPLSVVAPDGTSTTNISYAPNSGDSAETLTVTDAVGSTRQASIDGLGRMTQVVEDPSGLDYATQYTYDLLGDLASVTQGSSQSRSFTWNMRGWLLSVTNPETGSTATTYTYDNNGNQTLRQDARGISTCYSYTYNRLTSQTYYASGGSCSSNNTSSPVTPNVSYSYDTGATNAHGRLVSISNTAAVDAVSGYDELGRITGSSQAIGGGSARSFSYTYNLADALTQTTYPSGRTVTNSYDLANRIGSVTGALSGTSTPYVVGPGACADEGGTMTAICYAASGAPNGFTYANSLARAYTYNSLQQPTAMTDTLSGSTLFSLNYTFGASGTNNGNPSQVVGGGSGSGTGFTQNYFYDKLNRLCAAGEGATVVTITTCPSSSGGGAPTTGVNWAQNLRYDQYGNMWQQSQAGLSSVAALAWMPTAQSQIDATSNHLTVSGLAYDSGGGNQTTFLGTSTSSPIQYDAENRQAQVVDGLGNTFKYTYDGLGQRVSRQENSGTVTNYVHDVFGNLAAEYNPPSAAACTTCYLSWDHLGSTRMVTDAGGNIVARHDYLPFGVELPRSWSVTDGLSPKFTGQDHDSETLLEFYQARYLAAGLGRFMSVDPGNAGADLTDPQSWNMYSYVRNSPLTFVDPSGLDDCQADDSSCGDCDDDPYAASCGGDGGGGWPGGGGGTDPNNPNGYVPGVVYASGPQVGPGTGADQQQNATTTQGQSTDYATISYWWTGARGFGHIGIGVNGDDTWGYSTVNSHVPWYKRLFGAPAGGIENDIEHHTNLKTLEVAPHSYLHIPISAAQAQAMQAAIAARDPNLGSGGRYNLIFNNCAQFVESVLRAGGVPGVPHGEVFGPAILGAIIWYEITWH